ncbi:MAG: hypothetical protein HC892_19500, partial [Saprospiraceae bacterium]|nr:hypothetical protein [Saprospiraceae bacterium]
MTDARYFAAWEVEWLGFCLDSNSERAVPIATVRAIKDWVDGVKIVGEFGWQELQEITAIANDLSLDGIQLNMFSTLEDAIALKDYFLFKEIVVEKDKKLATLQPILERFSAVVGCFILNFSKNSILFEDLMLETTLLEAWCQTLSAHDSSRLKI